jgi:PKD repeat protein
VTFTNLTTGATKPYKTATWRFGDGTDPVVQSGAQAQTGQTVTHTYAIPGIFDVTVTMKDADDVVAFQVELDYIEVGEGGEPPVDYVTWTFNFDGFVPRCLDADYQGTTYLADLDPASIPASVQGVYYEDGTFWAPGAPGTTLTYLGGDQDPLCYMISVIPTPASWTIPLMP